MIMIYQETGEQPTAFFVNRPSRIEDLIPPHLQGEPHRYKVTVTAELSGIDYHNFVTDFKADRPFLYEHMNESYIMQGVWHCILVRQRGSSDGVLVMTSGRDYPSWVAYLQTENT